jgi:Tol biopolymer transport system component
MVGPPEISLIREELEKISSSPLFAQSRRLQVFLEFLVNAALNGSASQLKESVIAAEVYGRGEDFDPKLDSIVRTEASRLRKRLEEYYGSRGALDLVRFELPKGAYVLRIEVRPVASPEPQKPETTKPGPIGRGVLVLALSILLSAGAWLYVSLRGRNNNVKPPTVTVLATYPGYQLHPALSPDGKQLAFVWNGTEDNYDIYVKKIDEETPRRLTTDEAEDLNPAWSPDGSQIAFLRASPTRKEIFVIPAGGGPERRIAEIDPVAVPWVREASIMRRTPGPAWSPDGQYLAVTDRCTGLAQSHDCIYLLSVDGLQRRRLTSGAAIGDYAPVFSPDGKQVAFLRTVADVGIADIYVQSVDGTPERRLTFDGKMASSVAWSAGHRIFFVSNRSGPNLLWSIPDSGREAQLVAGAGRPVRNVSAASRVNRIVYTQSFRNANLWRTNLTVKGRPPVELIGSSRVTHSAQYSPDGSQIVFISDRSGGPEIWICQADGSNQRRLTFSSTNRPIGSPNWSPDGKLIVYDSAMSGYSQIYLMNADATNQRRFTTDNWDEMMPTWSRDGRFIYYIEQRNGARSLWKKPLTGGNPILISDGAFTDGLESPDGKRVMFSKSGPGIWEASVDGGDERPIPELAGVVHSRYLFAGGKGLYFVARVEPPWQVHYFDLGTRRISTVAVIDRTLVFSTRSLSISPDGNWMLHAQVDQIGSEISMIADP